MKQLGVSEVGIFIFPILRSSKCLYKTGMMVRPPNLEDIFVELTGRQLD